MEIVQPCAKLSTCRGESIFFLCQATGQYFPPSTSEHCPGILTIDICKFIQMQRVLKQSNSHQFVLGPNKLNIYKFVKEKEKHIHVVSYMICVHYSDVIKSAMGPQIIGVSIVYSTVCSGADQRNYQSSAWPVNSPRKGPVTRKNISIWLRHHVTAVMIYWTTIHVIYRTLCVAYITGTLDYSNIVLTLIAHICYSTVCINGSILASL